MVEQNTSTPVSSSPRPLAWFFGAIAAVTLSAAIAVNFPDRIKSLGLLPIIWAGLIGFGLRWWADESQVSIRGWPTILSLLLIAAGEVGILLGGWAVYRSHLLRKFKKHPTISLEDLATSRGRVDSVEKDKSTSDESAVRRQQEAEHDAKIWKRRQEQLQLSTFLHYRLLRLGSFSTPWPEIFCGVEIICGTFVGVWCFRKGVFDTKSSDNREPPDSQTPANGAA